MSNSFEYRVSLGDLMDSDWLIDLYCDWIDFKYTFFDPNLKPDFNLLRRNQLKRVRIISKSLNSIERYQIYIKIIQNRLKNWNILTFSIFYLIIFDLILIKRLKLHRKTLTLIKKRSKLYRNGRLESVIVIKLIS